jgi:hypothetical protein
MNLAHHEVEIAHALRSVLLGEEGVLIGLPQNVQEDIVRLEV